MMKGSRPMISSICGATLLILSGSLAPAADIVRDAEYYILNTQNGERWAAEDAELDAKLAELRKEHGQPPGEVNRHPTPLV